MSYNIKLHPTVNKFLSKCDNLLQKRITEKLRLLKDDPFRYLEHYEGRNFHKLRIGQYRALIDIDIPRKTVFVRVLDHRKRIYKK